MKKVVCMLVCCALVMGSITALAAGSYNCPHDSIETDVQYDQIDCYTAIKHTTKVCIDCGEELSYTTSTVRRVRHHKVTETENHDGEEVTVTYCTECGEEF